MAYDTAAGYIEKLGMIPHVEGGHYAFVSQWGLDLPRAALPAGYDGDRNSASLIYYLLQRGEESAWHMLRSAELWMWHDGGSLETVLGGTGRRPIEARRLYLGPRFERGERYGLIIPAGHWQTTRPIEGDFVLVSCIVSPAFADADFCFPPETQT